MNRHRFFPLVLLAFCGVMIDGVRPCAAAGRLVAEYLRCEYQVDPLGIDEPAPRLSWRLNSSVRGDQQTAWRIMVATSRELLDQNAADLWDSGLEVGDDSIGAVYEGHPLVSRQICYWKVQLWDKDHRQTPWSQPAMWSMGLLQKSDWRGQWIGFDRLRGETVRPAPFGDAKWIWFAGDKFPRLPKGTCYFMSSFDLPPDAKVAKAELLLVAHDRVLFDINGQHVKTPQAADPNFASLIDVMSQIKPGKNILRAGVEAAAPGPAGLIAKLVVVTDAGATNIVVTGNSWRSTNNAGPNWISRTIKTREWPAAQIIGPPGCLPWGDLNYAPLMLFPPSQLRKEFTLSKPIRRATLYATALGVVDLHLNGQRVSEDRFTPGWTDYSKRVLYRTYDVSKLVRNGQNALGAVLADGWFSGYVGWGQARDHYGKKPRFRGQLEIEYVDGSREIIGTGPDWKASDGATLEADFLMGEKYDARLENHWDQPGFDDDRWASVSVGAEMNPLLQSDPGPPVRAFAALPAKGISESRPGVYIFDMGQNFAGVARLKIRGQRGAVVTLRFGERLNPDGTLYTDNLRGARATDTYICKGDGIETWEPRFTYHGFQYVEVTGLDKRAALDTIVGIAVSSATSNAGSFACSDPMLNRLERNIYWTQRANYIDIPTDCPQRDERLGWMGDAGLFIASATLHEDVQAFFTKWLTDVQDDQRADGQFPAVAPLKVAGDDGGPAWSDAGVICPWAIYETYGDKRLLERHYDSMVRFIEFCRKRSTPDLLPPKDYHCYGDWLNLKDETPNGVIYTAYFAHSADLLARAADVLGKTADSVKYNTLFEKIRAAFNRAYVAPNGRIAGDTQTDYALALAFGLLDGENVKLAAHYLVDTIQRRQWHIAAGILGARSLMPALTQVGRDDAAQRLIHNETFPSWGYTINQGATTIWERWDGWTPEKGFQDPGMNSFSQYAFGSVYQWIVEDLGGIQSSSPGYKSVLIAPRFDSLLNFADTTYDSIRGPIGVHWKRIWNGIRLQVSIPPNITATVRIPSSDVRDITESRVPVSRAPGVTFVQMDGAVAVFKVGSGTYDFSVAD